MSPRRRSANRSATALPLRLRDAQGGYCASRTAGRPATQPRAASVCPSGEGPSGPAGPTYRLHRGSPHAVTSAAASQPPRRGPRRARHRQPIGPPAWEVARGVPATNHILALFLTPGPGSASDCSLVWRKPLKDARKEGPKESGLAGGLRPSASWGRGRSKGRGEVVPLQAQRFGDFLDGISE